MRDFTVGGVLRRVSALFRARPGLILGLAVLFVAVPYAFALAALRLWQPRNPGLGSAAFLVSWVGSLLLQAAVVRIAIDAANRRLSRFAGLLGTAARQFLPVLMISILFGLAVAIASVLLVFPGMMLFCRWFIVVPVRVAEGGGIGTCFGRSAALTDGVRWRVLGVFLVLSVLGLLANLVTGFLGGFTDHFLPGGWFLTAATVAGTWLSILIGSLFYAATYMELREIREGAMSEDLIAVFS